MSLVDFLIELKEKNQKYYHNYLQYARLIKELAIEELQDKNIEVLIIGSIVSGKWIANKSDIDLLIVSKKVLNTARWQSDTKTRILVGLGDLTAPFEIHLATPQLYETWYSRFIKEDQLVKV
jgi:uncharacterized protein